MNSDEPGPVAWSLAIGFVVLLFVGVGGALMWGCPRYEVYKRTLTGQAELQQAQSNRQIAVFEAQAKLESAKSLAAAEVERAKGVAEANRIIGEGAQGPRGISSLSLDHVVGTHSGG